MTTTFSSPHIRSFPAPENSINYFFFFFCSLGESLHTSDSSLVSFAHLFPPPPPFLSTHILTHCTNACTFAATVAVGTQTHTKYPYSSPFPLIRSTRTRFHVASHCFSDNHRVAIHLEPLTTVSAA